MHVILIPAYEPDARLVALVRSLAPRTAVVVVDDGSGSAYAPVFAASAAAGALTLAHGANRGKGAALRTGLTFIAAHWPGADVVTADADGQHTPADIARVGAALASARSAHPVVSGSPREPFALPGPGEAIILGVRAFTGRVPLRSRAGNAVTRGAFRLATGRDIRDTQTGLRGFPASRLPWLQTIGGDRFDYEFRMLLAARSAGVDLIEVPIETVYVDDNASSHFRPLADSARIYAPLLRFTASALLAFIVDTAVLLALQTLTGALLPSIVLARVVSSGMNFAINRGLVFGGGRSVPVRTAALRYFSLAGLLLAASFGMLTALTDAGLETLPAKLLTDATLFVVSFAVQRAVVFAPASSGSERHARPTRVLTATAPMRARE